MSRKSFLENNEEYRCLFKHKAKTVRVQDEVGIEQGRVAGISEARDGKADGTRAEKWPQFHSMLAWEERGLTWRERVRQSSWSEDQQGFSDLGGPALVGNSSRGWEFPLTVGHTNVSSSQSLPRLPTFLCQPLGQLQQHLTSPAISPLFCPPQTPSPSPLPRTDALNPISLPRGEKSNPRVCCTGLL